MKLIAYEAGQILFRVPVEEVRPLSGLYLPDLITGIAERYAFVSRSTDFVEVAKTGAKFQLGRIRFGDTTIAIKQLDLYNDGLLITTSHTDETELVFVDLYNFLKSVFGFRELISYIYKIYFSSVVVELEKPIDSLLSKFADITNDFVEAIKTDNNVDIVPGVYRIALAADPRNLPPFTQTQFLIERRVETDWALNRYLATAPLTTKSLIAIMERLERHL